MGVCTSWGVGQYVAAEAHSALYGRSYKTDASKRPILVFTGGPGNARDFIDTAASGSAVNLALAEQGWDLFSAAYGGADLWGNATTVTRLGQAWSYAKTLLGCKTDKFIGVGVSKGCTALLNYTKANPSNVAALALFLPCVDIQDIDTNNRGGNSANIQTAYGGAPPDASNPADNMASFTGTPMKLWYASDDSVVLPQTVTDFATATGAATQSLGAVGHTAATVNAAQVAAFLTTYV